MSGEADHMKPFSKGGETQVENCQLIGGRANKRKGANYMEPRKWQQEFLDKWQQRERHQPFMLIAIPGSGKTWAALKAAHDWRMAASDRRIIVVVPTDNLRTQWEEDAAKFFGLELQTKELGTNFKDGFQGGIATYSLVASNRALFRSLCSRAPTMVIFDEIHHCGDEAAFGEGVKHSFELARERLLMSGTPWKSDGTQIPFVRYDGNGYAVGDFHYDYPRALNDDVVRYLVFNHAKGSLENNVTGHVETLSSDVSDVEASQRLRRLLDPAGEYVREQIRAAHEKLLDCRKAVPDAGALAACVDQAHAVKVAEAIREVTGCEPSLIVSDGEIENDTVKDFRKSSREWLVAVRKVSEGTDIKRLQVLCYLTNTTSELFFRQLIGRVSRVRNLEDFEGYVYLPADPRLVRCAENIANAQVQALREQVERELRERSDGQAEFQFDSFSTRHEGAELVFIGNERIPLAEAQEIERCAEASGVSMQKVLDIWRFFEATNKEAAAPQAEVQTKQGRMDELRSQLKRKAFILSKLSKEPVEHIHAKYKRHFGKSQSKLTEDELRQKLAMILEECNEHRS